jgi:hypothetical protein
MNTCVEYLVLTECGRRFCWSAIDEESLRRDLEYRHYKPTFVQLYSEYEAEMHRKEEQEKLVAEHTADVKGEKPAA